MNTDKNKRKIIQSLKKARAYIFPVLFYILLVASCLGILILFSWAILSTFKDPYEWYISSWKFPSKWTFVNYITAASKIQHRVNSYTVIRFWGMAWNTLLYAGVNALLATISAAFVSYIVARYKGVIPFVGVLWTLYLIYRFMPAGSSLAAQLRYYKIFGFYDSMIGNWFVNLGPYSANFLLFYAMWKGLGSNYVEAAKIDGANEFIIFSKIMLPLISGFVVFTFIGKFIGLYQDWKGPMIFLPSYPTLSYGIWTMQYSVEPGMAFVPARLAGLIIMSIIPFAGFMATRKRMMKGVSIGAGLKG